MQLSILIPARNEMFLAKTIEDILKNIEADTEIIVVLDGQWAEPPISQHERVNIIYLPKNIGQRAATNLACRLSTAKYVMKVDAHCAFDKGFDRKLIEDMQDDWTMVPTMKNLWGFDWICPKGHRRYQSPSGPCRECGEPTQREIMWAVEAPRGSTARGQWKRRAAPASTAFCFDSEPHFQYHHEFERRPEGQGDLTESMSIQGSCFMVTREKYWELDLSDETFGSWGSQGIEVACKTWLSGGKVVCSHKTWYAHLFRTQGKDFGFPYPQEESQIQGAKNLARELFFENKWPKQKLPLKWLVKKFWPITPSEKTRGWTQEELDKLPDMV